MSLDKWWKVQWWGGCFVKIRIWHPAPNTLTGI